MSLTRDGEIALILTAIAELTTACERAGVSFDVEKVPGLSYVRHAAERARKGERPDPAQPYSPKPRPKVVWTEPTTNRQIDYPQPAPEREPIVQQGTSTWRRLEEEAAADRIAAEREKKPPLAQRIGAIVGKGGGG